MSEPRPFGLTVQVRAGDDARAREFYGLLLGRAPDYSPHDDFHEWEVASDAWVQVVTGCDPVVPSPNRMRFQVADLATAIGALRAAGVAVGEPTILPGVVTFTDLSDPWGNPLGLYEDIAGPDGPTVPGGTVRDESHFEH